MLLERLNARLPRLAAFVLIVASVLFAIVPGSRAQVEVGAWATYHLRKFPTTRRVDLAGGLPKRLWYRRSEGLDLQQALSLACWEMSQDPRVSYVNVAKEACEEL